MSLPIITAGHNSCGGLLSTAMVDVHSSAAANMLYKDMQATQADTKLKGLKRARATGLSKTLMRSRGIVCEQEGA